MVSPRYCLLPADLRDTAALAAALEGAGFDSGLPTFVMSECVLVYMEPQHSAAVVRWLGATLRCAAMAIYEQVRVPGWIHAFLCGRQAGFPAARVIPWTGELLPVGAIEGQRQMPG